MTELKSVADEAVIKAMAHPLRVKILGAVSHGAASPRELSDQLDTSIGTVAYHVRFLVDLGLLKLVRTAPRRGATEHWYELDGRPTISSKAWGELPDVLQDSVIGVTLRDMALDIERAGSSGGFEREDIHLSRVPMVLDEQGWKKVSKLMDRTLEQVMKIEDEARARIQGDPDAEALGARTVLMFFETPKRRRRKPNNNSSG
jgi:DNA-binding transcriptional ArsR family regulator